MSRAFVESFFPSLSYHLQSPNSRVRLIYEFLLPADAMQFCPEVIARLYTFHGNSQELVIRNPVLLIGSVFGAILGIYIGLFDTYLGFMPLSYPKKSEYPIRNLAPIFWWSVSFLFFGLMNVAAIPLHSFFPLLDSEVTPGKTPLPQQCPFLWIMDSYCTGVFSLALTIAGCHSHMNQFRSTDVELNRGFLLTLLLLVGCIPIARFLLYGSTIELELWYSLPVAFCATYYAFDLFLAPHLQTGSSPVLTRSPLNSIYIAVLLILIAGVFLDAPLCRWSSPNRDNAALPWFWDAGRLPTIAFLACDLAFVGLFLERRRSLATSVQKREKIHQK